MSLASSITVLQIACVPVDVSADDIFELSRAFPNIETLQIMQMERVNNPFHPNVDFTTTLFPSVKHLHLGVPWNFFPGRANRRNVMLTFLEYFAQTATFPSLQRVMVQPNVDHIPGFIYRRARQLECVIASSQCGAVYRGVASDPTPSTISSIVFVLDASTPQLSVLPPSVMTVSVVLPFLPTWRRPRSLRRALDELLGQVLTSLHDAVERVTLEYSEVYTTEWITATRALFTGSGVSFELLHYGELSFDEHSQHTDSM